MPDLLTTILFLCILASVLLCCVSGSHSHHKNHDEKSRQEYDLPVINSDIRAHLQQLFKTIPSTEYPKYIPRNAWIAVRNKSEERAAHMTGATGFVARNNLWKIEFCGNEEKDHFMHTVYHNTSLLWAYNILNPVIGTAKAELWRLAILYYYGGLYMDDDASFSQLLDDIVKPHYKLIVGVEGYNWTDNCYTNDYPLSNHSLNLRFGATNHAIFFHNRYFFNWAMFSMPGHPVILRIMEHVVQLIKYEYIGQSKIKMTPQDHRGKLLMCASTYPITLAMREVLLECQSEQEKHALGIYIGDDLFREFGGNMKAWNNDHNPNRWVKQLQKKRLPYLRAYTIEVGYYEGKVIQGENSREIFLVKGGKKHGFPDFNTFLGMNYGMKDVRIVSQEVLMKIPSGDPLPSFK